MTERIPVAEASVADLRNFAEVIMGLDVDPKMGRERILSLMHKAGYGADTIARIDSLQTPAPTGVSNHPGEAPAFCRRRVGGVTFCSILIPTSDEKGGDRPQQVHVNGRAILIPRATPCWVPEPYVEVLEHMVRWVWDNDPDSQEGLQDEQLRKVLEVPFSFVPPMPGQPGLRADDSATAAA